MGAPKRIGLIVSGRTDRAAIPVLLKKVLPWLDLDKGDILLSPHGCVTAEGVRKGARALWWTAQHQGRPLDKILVIPDADAKEPQRVRTGLEEEVRNIEGIECPFFVRPAKWHLEAWFFGDEQGLRRLLGRDLGQVNPSDPDSIENPKQHLKNLLGGRFYTTEVAKEIAEALDGRRIRDRSRSFRDLQTAAANGPLSGGSDEP